MNIHSNSKILLGTGNLAKQETLRWLLDGLSLRCFTPSDLGLTTVPDETGSTHLEIACQKALQWSATTSMLVIASDGGLTVPSLGDCWESRFTHRFAGQDASDEDRVKQLLELMKSFTGEDRKASWIESIAIADHTEVLTSWEITGADGLISNDPVEDTGIPGFWVFSIWFIPQFGKYYNQLTTFEKETINDHWGQLKRNVQAFFQKRSV
tara:strand:+ start:431 stop:1060 length:630 start_codon:yes stop_codon:yes gene_type:complete